MNFDTIKEVKKQELEGIGIIGMDDDGNFEFSDSILDDDMDDIEREGKKILKSIKPSKKKATKAKASPVKVEQAIQDAPRKYTIQFNKNEVEEAELAFATLSSLGSEVEIKDIFNYVMTKGFTAEEKFEIQKISSSRVLEEKLNKYLKEHKLKMDKEELLLHLLNEKIQ